MTKTNQAIVDQFQTNGVTGTTAVAFLVLLALTEIWGWEPSATNAALFIAGAAWVARSIQWSAKKLLLGAVLVLIPATASAQPGDRAMLQDIIDQCKGSCDLPPGDYILDGPLHMPARGEGQRIKISAFGCSFSAQGHGLIVDPGAGLSVWEGGFWRGQATSVADLADEHVGLKMLAAATVRHAQFSYFWRGIEIWCGSETGGANCNGFFVSQTVVSSTLLDGVFIKGRDANAGLTSGLKVSNVCKAAASVYPEPTKASNHRLRSCAGINEVSFLGNAHLAAQVHESIDTLSSTRAIDGGYMRFYQVVAAEDSNNRSTFVHPYTESGGFGRGNGPSVLWGYGPKAFGGMNRDWLARGGALNVTDWSTFTRVNVPGAEREGYPQMTMCLGDCNGLGSPFHIYVPSAEGVQTAVLSLMYVGTPTNLTVELEYGRASRQYLGRYNLNAQDFMLWLPNEHPHDSR